MKVIASQPEGCVSKIGISWIATTLFFSRSVDFSRILASFARNQSLNAVPAGNSAGAFSIRSAAYFVSDSAYDFQLRYGGAVFHVSPIACIAKSDAVSHSDSSEPVVRRASFDPPFFPVVRVPGGRVAELVQKLKYKLRPEVSLRGHPNGHASVGAMILRGVRAFLAVKNEEARQLPSRVLTVFPERFARRSKHCSDVLIASLEPLADAEI